MQHNNPNVVNEWSPTCGSTGWALTITLMRRCLTVHPPVGGVEAPLLHNAVSDEEDGQEVA